MIPGTFSTHALEDVPSSKRARSMLFMVRWLRSLTAFPSGWYGEVNTRWTPRERINFPHELATAVGQEAARGTKIWYDMPEEGVTHRVCGVIASRDKDSVPGIAIHKHDEELMSVVGGERAHNVHRERISWTLGLYGAHRFQSMSIIAPQLTLWAALSNLYAEAVTGYIRIPVAEEFPQGLTA